jgi:hypothetical protein
MNIDSMATLQHWLVAAGIGLGIGGSLLASLFVGWARRRPDDVASEVLLQPSAERLVFAPNEAASRAKRGYPWVVAVLIFFIAVTVGLLRRMIGGRAGD